MTQGTLTPTGGDLDIAIRGEGYFKIQMTDGTMPIRATARLPPTAGRVVNAQGNPVQPTITIPRIHPASPLTPRGRFR